MATFVYRIKDKAGRDHTGTLEAENELAAAAKLRAMGYYILEIRNAGSPTLPSGGLLALASRRILKPVFGGANTWQLAFFFRQLHMMLKSGMTITHALDSLGRQGGCGRGLRRVARESADHVKLGSRLSEALRCYPWIFQDLHIALIRAGEESGTLDVSLGRLADYLDREQAIRQRLRVATFYPKVLVMAVIFIPALPTLIFSGFRAYLKETLHTLLPLLLIILAVWVGYRTFSAVYPFRYVLDVIKLKIPKIGSAVRMLALSRFYRVVATMFAAGVPVGEALAYGAKATGNIFLMRRIESAIPMVRQGSTISESLARSGVLPPVAMDMLRTGEQSGEIDALLTKAAEYAEGEAEVAISQMTVVLGVLLLLGIAAYIGTVVVNFYVSRYSTIINQF